MDSTAFSKHLFKLAGRLAVAVGAYWLLRKTGLYQFTAPEADGLHMLILLVGSIYAVIYAFVIFVIWGQFTEVENLLVRECSSLDDLLRFSRYLNADASHAIRRAVIDYVHLATKSEWEALAGRRKDQQTERSFTGLMNAVIQAVPANPAEHAIHDRLIEIARKAGEHRDERITKSLTRIPPTLIHLVRTMAGVLLLLIFVYPFHHWLAGACSFVLIAVVLFLANLVMMDTDNPFQGVCNVSPQPFADLAL